MKPLRETRQVPLATRNGTTVEGVMRVTGFDATVAGRGVVLAQQRPVAIIERRDATVRRHGLPGTTEGPPLPLLFAAPVVAWLAARLLSPSRPRRKR